MCASFWRPLSRRGFVGTGSYPRSRAPCRVVPPPPTPLRASATSRPPLRQIRRDRRRFRTTDNRESVRLPSDRPGPCGPGGLGRACCSCAQPRPAPCRLPRSLPAPSRTRGPLQAIPRSQLCLATPPFTTEKMLLSDFCNRRSSNEHPADCSIPGCVLACYRLAPDACEIASSSWAKGLTAPRVGDPGTAYRTNHRAELRLTANLRLRPPPQRGPSSVMAAPPRFGPREPLT